MWMDRSADSGRAEDHSPIAIRPLESADVDALAEAFASWPKPRAHFERYAAEHAAGLRVVLVARRGEEVCGYGVIVWRPDYPPFRESGIPEIQDLNVLPGFRGEGIATGLLDAAEALAATRSPVVGIGVGLYADYGPAQRLYAVRGYLPDARGASWRDRPVRGGEPVIADDDLVIHLTKSLRVGGDQK
jgi:GNAT superfamily N-acetyltransferase